MAVPKSSCRSAVAERAQGQLGELRKHLAGFGFHGAAVEGGADLELALDCFIEIADGDGRHEIRR